MAKASPPASAATRESRSSLSQAQAKPPAATKERSTKMFQDSTSPRARHTGQKTSPKGQAAGFSVQRVSGRNEYGSRHG